MSNGYNNGAAPGQPVYYAAPPQTQQQPGYYGTASPPQQGYQQGGYQQQQQFYAAQGFQAFGPPPYINDGRFGPHWTFDVFDCFSDFDECLDTYCCHYCKMGYMYHKLQRGILGMDGAVCCGSCCVDGFFLIPVATMAMTYTNRAKILQRYGILEDGLHTFFFSLFCCACALCQQAREMKVRGEMCGGVCITPPPPQMMPMGGNQGGYVAVQPQPVSPQGAAAQPKQV